MNPARIAAIVLIAVGVLGLAYGGFSYTSDRQELSVGSLSVTVDQERTVPIPMWAGIAAVVVGASLLLMPATKS